MPLTSSHQLKKKKPQHQMIEFWKELQMERIYDALGKAGIKAKRVVIYLFILEKIGIFINKYLIELKIMNTIRNFLQSDLIYYIMYNQLGKLMSSIICISIHETHFLLWRVQNFSCVLH
jgi:hypothetical protein